MGVEHGESGLRTWFALKQICSTEIFPKALPGMQGMVYLNVILSLLLGNGLPSKDQVAKLGPVICVGSSWGFG